ncbi:MAG: hypothetical protein L7G97_03975 [Acidilobus sp.]|nr:hypothetical protein [Acidilobus sp.]
MRNFKKSSVPGYLVFAQSLSSIAPLSSTAALLTVAMEQALASTPIAVALGVALYGLWVAIGYGYSSVIASYGGTYDFARASAGEGVARAIGWTYWLGYSSYISAISLYLGGVLLPSLVRAPAWAYYLASFALPATAAGLTITGAEAPLAVTLATSLGEVAAVGAGPVIAALGLVTLAKTGLRPLTLSVPLPELAAGALTSAFTVAGGGASFFMGYEARRGAKDVSTSFLAAFLVGSAAIFFASYYEVAAAGFTNAGVESVLRATQYPGLWVAERFAGPALTYIYIALTLSSVAGTIIAAFMAVQRLTYALNGGSLDRSSLTVLAFVTALNVAGVLIGPSSAYVYVVLISLTALFTSHAALSALYASFSRRALRSVGPTRPLLAAGGVALMTLGLYYEVISVDLQAAAVGLALTAAAALLGLFQGYAR